MSGVIEKYVRIASNRKVANHTFLMALESREVVLAASPGQFVMVRVSEGLSPLLRRPFSIAATKRGDLFLLLYRVVGEGTTMMSKLHPGDRISVLGPLGKGFRTSGLRGPAFLVAGGIGLAPLIFLAQSLQPATRILVTGYGSAEEIVDLAEMGLSEMAPSIATDDGTAGYKGPATDLLESHLKSSNAGGVFACGPLPMLRKVREITRDRDLPCQMALEAFMACGLGACQGCAVKAATRQAQKYYRVCRDGPVFDAESIDWEAMEK